MKPWCIKAGFHPVSYWIIIREFKKLRLLLQQKRHIKIELWVWLSILRLFHVDHVVQNRRTALSVAWYQWFSRKGKEWKIYCCELAFSCRWKFHVVVLRQNIAPKSMPHVQPIIFLHSTNQIIDLWCCYWRCRRQILNSLSLLWKVWFLKKLWECFSEEVKYITLVSNTVIRVKFLLWSDDEADIILEH